MPGDRTARRAASRQRVQQGEAAKRMRQIQTEYAAERVLKSQRQEGGNTLYFVRWAHPYNHPSHDSWEPGQNLLTGLLRAFGGAEGAIPDDDAIANWRRTAALVGRRGVDPTVKGHTMWSFLKAVEGQHASKRSRQAPQQDIAAAASAQPATAAAPAASSPAAPAPAATGRGEGSEGSTAYVALSGVTEDFNYLLSFVGQANASNASGAELVVLMSDIAESAGATARNLVGVTTDGCASMRSDRAHAGVIPWAGSKPFVTGLKARHDTNLLALACGAHNVNLALGDAMRSTIPPFFMLFCVLWPPSSAARPSGRVSYLRRIRGTRQLLRSWPRLMTRL